MSMLVMLFAKFEYQERLDDSLYDYCTDPNKGEIYQEPPARRVIMIVVDARIY